MTEILLGFTILPALLGLFVLFHLFRGNKLPADKSNRINKIRLFWFALTREDKFVDTFDWLKYDEWENINKGEK